MSDVRSCIELEQQRIHPCDGDWEFDQAETGSGVDLRAFNCIQFELNNILNSKQNPMASGCLKARAEAEDRPRRGGFMRSSQNQTIRMF